MSNVPGDLKYVKSHEWVKILDDGTLLIGISDHAQEALGDLVFVETPDVGTMLAAGDSCAVVESVKAASDVYAPVSGEVIESNSALDDAPEILNTDPYTEGWLFKLKPDNASDVDALLDATAYEASLDD